MVNFIEELRAQIDRRCPHPYGRAICQEWLFALCDALSARELVEARRLYRLITKRIAHERLVQAYKWREIRRGRPA